MYDELNENLLGEPSVKFKGTDLDIWFILPFCHLLQE